MGSRRLLLGLLAASIALAGTGGVHVVNTIGGEPSAVAAAALVVAADGAPGREASRTEAPAPRRPSGQDPTPTTVAASAVRSPAAGGTSDRADGDAAGGAGDHDTARAAPATEGAAAAASPAGGPTTTTAPAGPLPPEPVARSAPAPQTGAHAFMRTNPDGSPVRYDRRQPIRFMTRLAGGPVFARAELDWAVAQVEAASGLDLVWAGDVAGSVSSGWAHAGPVYIGFETAAEFPMPSTASGYADSWTVDDGGGFRHYVGGRLVLRPDHGWTRGTASTNPLGLMFLHELGHLVGLGHVDVATEVMTDRGNGTVRALGPGDRVGFAAIGQPL